MIQFNVRNLISGIYHESNSTQAGVLYLFTLIQFSIRKWLKPTFVAFLQVQAMPS